jgi:hypothetical protein
MEICRLCYGGELGFGRQMCGVYSGPHLDHWKDLGWSEIRKSQVVGGRECYNIAFSSDRLGTQ